MKARSWKLAWILWVLVLGVGAPWLAGAAERRWVTDRLEVDLRRGKTMEFAITRMLPSGTPLDVLEQDQATGYSRVRLVSGTEGWVLTRYLVAEAPARSAVPELTARLETTDARNREVEFQLKSITAERDGLRRQLDEVKATADGLAASNEALAGRADREWFLAGGGAVVAGIVLGLVLPRLSFRRRRSGWDRL